MNEKNIHSQMAEYLELKGVIIDAGVVNITSILYKDNDVAAHIVKGAGLDNFIWYCKKELSRNITPNVDIKYVYREEHYNFVLSLALLLEFLEKLKNESRTDLELLELLKVINKKLDTLLLKGAQK